MNINILINLLIVVEILVSVLLILVILVQPSKSGGLGGALGGGMGEQLFGARTGNVLTKATIILASIFLANTLGLALLYSRSDAISKSLPLPPAPVIQQSAEPGMGAGAEEDPGTETTDAAGTEAPTMTEVSPIPPSAVEQIPGLEAPEPPTGSEIPEPEVP
jgi:preprotein translocase subunit SecG